MLVLLLVLSGCANSNEVGSSLYDTLRGTRAMGAYLGMRSMLHPQNLSCPKCQHFFTTPGLINVFALKAVVCLFYVLK